MGIGWEQGRDQVGGGQMGTRLFPPTMVPICLTPGSHLDPTAFPYVPRLLPRWSPLGPAPPAARRVRCHFGPTDRLAMAFTSTVTWRWPDGSGFLVNPVDEDDTIFMPSTHLVIGDPVVGDTVSYDVGPSPGVAYNVKAVVPEPGPLLQRRGQVLARSNPPAAAAAVTTAAELGEPPPGSRKQRLNPKRCRIRRSSAAPIAARPVVRPSSLRRPAHRGTSSASSMMTMMMVMILWTMGMLMMNQPQQRRPGR